MSRALQDIDNLNEEIEKFEKSPVKKSPMKQQGKLDWSDDDDAEDKVENCQPVEAMEVDKINSKGVKRASTDAIDPDDNRRRRVSVTDNEDSEEDNISDSEIEEDRPMMVTHQAGSRRQPKVDYKETAINSDSEEEDDQQSEEEEEAIDDVSDESSEEEEEEKQQNSDDEEEEDAGNRRPRRAAAATANKFTAKTHKSPARRSTRRAASKTMNYNEREFDAMINQAINQNEDSDDDADDDGSKAPKRDRKPSKAALAAIKKKKKIAAARRAAAAKRKVINSESDNSDGNDESSDNSDFLDSDASDMEVEEVDSEDEIYLAEDDCLGAITHEAAVQNVERILAAAPKTNNSDGDDDLVFLKVTGRSYRKATWVSRTLVAASRAQLLRNFDKKLQAGQVDPYGDLENGVHPDWLVIDRIVAEHARREEHAIDDGDAKNRMLLVKWKGLGYSDATWELESTLTEPGDERAISRYDAACKRRNPTADATEEAGGDYWDAKKPAAKKKPKRDDVPEFENGRQLRDYQKESLKWMVNHRWNRTNCILGDEMGLGKTAQSIAVLEYQRQLDPFGTGCAGPFLIIAPLTTLGHWQREIETWTTMDVIVYAGSAKDREIIQKYDLWDPIASDKDQKFVKPDVVLTSFDTILRDKEIFQLIRWDSVIIDEAHRMKSTSSSTRQAVQEMTYDWLLLLTGTPVQNNMRELYGLLNLLDPDEHYDEEEFLSTYGDERTGMTPEQVRLLQQTLKPLLLRRMKEDVEDLPEKEEVIIWVELTKEQRAYYKAIYEKQIGTLLSGTSAKNLPNMRNLAMELRKVCCHPCMCDGLEEDMAQRRAAIGQAATDLDLITQASGKMLLLHKLLPKLKAEGRKVLIFSQFKMMLDVLEDYLHLSGHPFERIDGSTSGRDRQAAIDRFSKEDSESFVFLLSTRAGGQGITLTAADTCIIYDSDWNPQNDLQAMARCHRIGQDKDVTIYRLVCRDTYEQQVFQTSSRKYGLDEAILGTTGANNNEDPEADGKKIADLLKHGAHCLHEVDTAEENTDAFASEDIDQILNGRTEKRQIGSRAGNTFSVATFGAAAGTGADGDGEQDLEQYWKSLLPDAAAAHEDEKSRPAAAMMLAPRIRKTINYSEDILRQRRRKNQEKADDADYNDAGSDDDEDGGGKSTKTTATKGGAKKAGTKGAAAQENKKKDRVWAKIDATEYLEAVLRFGFNNVDKVRRVSGVDKKQHTIEECLQYEQVLKNMMMLKPPKAPKSNKATKAATDVFQASLALMEPAARAEKERIFKADQERAEQILKEYEESLNSTYQMAKENAHALLPATLKPAVDDKLIQRVVKNADRYKTHVDQLTKLGSIIKEWDQVEAALDEKKEAGDVSHLRLPFVARKSSNTGFPSWWTRADDVAFMRAIHELGLDLSMHAKQKAVFERIFNEARFGISTRVYKQAALADKQPIAADKSHVSMSVDNNNNPDAAATVVATAENNKTAAADSFSIPADATGGSGSAPSSSEPDARKAIGMTVEAYTKFQEAMSKHIKALLSALCAPNMMVGGSFGTGAATINTINADLARKAKAMLERMDKTGSNSLDPISSDSDADAAEKEKKPQQQVQLNRLASSNAAALADSNKMQEENKKAKSPVPLAKSESSEDEIEDISPDDDDEVMDAQPAAREKAVATPKVGNADDDDGITPITTKQPRAVNVFEETRGTFTGGEANGATTATGPKGGNDLRKMVLDNANNKSGTRQASLYEFKKIKVTPRSVMNSQQNQARDQVDEMEVDVVEIDD